jgi:pimeloyl-ACP methyl ester carboxylesterase/DNA-binding CsgD family transcriptional regulator
VLALDARRLYRLSGLPARGTFPRLAMQQHIRFCKTADGVRLAYATAGAGPPLVKVANWLSHIEYDWRTPMWRPTFERLARTRRLVRYDERGCGLSDWGVEDFSLDAWVRDLEAVVDAAGLDRFPLFGISQGGPIAIAYAVRHPERVTRLVLHGAYARGYALRDPAPAQREENRLLVDLMRLGWGRESPAFRQVFTSQFYPDGWRGDLGWFNELQRLSSSSENAARMFEAFGMLDVQDIAPLVTVPTLVLHSRRDETVPHVEGRLLATLIPDADFVTLESRHHVLNEDEPAFEPFMRAVEDFLAAGDDVAPPPAPFRELTEREEEVLELVARGIDNRTIADGLRISDKTVRNHVTNIFWKLGVATRAEAIVRAREAGMGGGRDASRDAGPTKSPRTPASS